MEKNYLVTGYEAERVMEKALDIGEAMLCTGGEILRVEDTIMRICLAYGGGIVDVFTILSLIIVSWHTTDDRNYTHTRRIYAYANDLNKLEDLNALSRYICDNRPSCDEIEEKFEKIMYAQKKGISTSQIIGYICGAAGFAVFFGGNIRDGIAAALVALFVYFYDYLFGARSKNRVVYTLICSFFTGIMCKLTIMSGLGVHVDKVMIGSIMLLIPGINFTNSIRDMICGDIITGSLRLVEAIMVAVCIAVGFAIAIIGFRELVF